MTGGGANYDEVEVNFFGLSERQRKDIIKMVLTKYPDTPYDETD